MRVLDVDEDGNRPGHPLPGYTSISTALAADRLLTSVTTVRKMIDDGDLAGYWARPAGRVRAVYAVYEEALVEYLAAHGNLGHARRDRPRSGRTSGIPLPSEQTIEGTRERLDELAREVSHLRADLDRLSDVGLLGELNAETARRVEMEEALAAIEAADEHAAAATRLRANADAEVEMANAVLRRALTASRTERFPR